MSLESLIGDDTISFARPVNTKDALGGVVGPTYPTNYAENVPGRVEDASAQDVQMHMAQGIKVTHRIFHQTADVAIDDRVTTSDGRYVLMKKCQKRRAMSGSLINTYYTDFGEEWRPGP